MTRNIGNKIIRLEKIESTNTYLKNNFELVKHHGLVVITKMQTSGRGRAGRKFISIPHKNVTFSVVLHPKLPIEKLQLFSLLAGIVVARVLENYVDEIRLKWPNDVLVRGKKICGILLETIVNNNTHYPYLILGIGINTKGTLKDYPIELQNKVTTLEEEIKENTNVIDEQDKELLVENEKIFQEILVELESCIKIFMKDDEKINSFGYLYSNYKSLIKEWLKRSKALGTKVRSLNKVEENAKVSEIVGVIEGLTSDGFLKIRTNSGQVITQVSGDVVDINEDEL